MAGAGGERLASASGLRPAGAFCMIAAVVVLVLARSVQIAFAVEGEQPSRLASETAPHGAYEIVDVIGRPLARSVERLDLVVSPRAMWRTHTPDYMAREIARTIGMGLAPSDLLARMLPDADEGGVVRVAPSELALDAWQAQRVSAWLAAGTTDPKERRREPVPGMWVEPAGAGLYALAWMPEITLAQEARAAHGVDAPAAWTRRLLADLATCLWGARPSEPGRGRDAWDARREGLWGLLLPRRYKIVAKGVPAAAAAELYALFERQGVNRYQMGFERGLDRRYPPREAGAAEVSAAELATGRFTREIEGDDGEFEVVGRWGFADGATAPVAIEGLELAAERLLASPEWSFLGRRDGVYAFDAWQATRRPMRPYYRAERAPDPVPRVVSTIDARVQRVLRRELEAALALHDAAVVLGIAVEVATGDVIAVDGVDAYDLAGFLPVRHTFTPGSTMKAVVMACALDAELVRPEDTFDTHDGHYRVPGSRRVIREARGAPTGIITASRAISESCNAVLVQIGMAVPAPHLRAKLVELGYGAAPAVGVNGEAPGSLPPLPWSPAYTHASIAFGHELLTTLWQHATALCTVVRGGEHRPLRLLRAVEREAERWELERVPPRRVLSERACAELRAMMMRGAREGTGERVACADLEMGTKTGTAEKVAAELCLHVELAHLAEHARDANGRAITDHRACRAALVGRRDHERSSCYTSSLCAFGRVPGTEREVLVLVVVEEPRSRAKFGADVAGAAAVAILREALDVTRGGAPPLALVRDFAALAREGARADSPERPARNAPAPSAGAASAAAQLAERPPVRIDPDGFAVSTSVERNPFERPWAVDVDAAGWALAGSDADEVGVELSWETAVPEPVLQESVLPEALLREAGE